MAFFLVMLSALATTLLVTWRVGELVNRKMRLVNAVDAAAYSGALLEARALNFDAYMQRAMIANECAIAQAVSARSWMAMVVKTGDNANHVVRFLGPIGRVSESAMRLIKGLATTTTGTLLGSEAAIGALNATLEGTVNLVKAATLESLRETAARTLRANDAGISSTVAAEGIAALNAVSWLNATVRYGRPGRQRERLKQVVLNSIDGFTRRRDAAVGLLGGGLLEAGGTDLLGYDAWRGLDTLSVHIPILFWDVEVPLGWGGGQAGKAAAQRGFHGGAYRSNPRSARLAEQTLRGTVFRPFRATNPAFRGLPGTLDIAHPTSRDDVRVLHIVEAARSAENSQLVSHYPATPAAMRLDGVGAGAHAGLPNGMLYALGAAEVYWARPVPRSDGRREYPSVLAPYWQARLTRVPVSAYTISIAENGFARQQDAAQ